MRLKAPQDVYSITDFRLKAKAIVKQVQQTKCPVILTQRGRSVAVLEDVEQYENRLERLDMLEKILRGVQEGERGEGISHKQAIKRLEEIISG